MISADGTAIAYDRAGAGPAVILVGGGATDRSENAPLAAALAARFTVFNYDRRGRGASGDTLPYAVQREFEDIAALVSEAGGSGHLFGASSGGALALEAAAAGVAIDRLAVYEVPYQTGDDWPAQCRGYVVELTALLAAGRRGDAFARFMRLAEVPGDAIAAALPASERIVLEGQGHVPDPAVLASVLTRFFAPNSDVRPGDSGKSPGRRSSL